MMYFKNEEFRCKCGKCGLGIESMDPRILSLLDVIRGKLGEPIKLNSAVRCATHNMSVGGSAKSEHVPQNTDTGLCTGVDIHIPNSTYLYKLVKLLYSHEVPRIGLNQAKMFIHVGFSTKHPMNVFFKY